MFRVRFRRLSVLYISEPRRVGNTHPIVFMKTKPTSQSAFFNLRVLTSLLVLLAGVFLAWFTTSAVGRTRHGQASPSGGSWVTTGSLNTARNVHTATLLSNGKVIVAGGNPDGTSATDSAELYDPASGIWTATGSLNIDRALHTATLLLNGKALVAAGTHVRDGFWVSIYGAELYDAASGSWTATSTPNVSRYWHTATLLPNGKVLVAGGAHHDPGECCVTSLASAELYDPASDSWTVTGSLHTARYAHAATLLPNGMVLVEGGYGSSVFDVLPTAELYDPATGTWTFTDSLNTGRVRHTAALLSNGNVLVVGGGDSNGSALASAELYDPASGRWTATGSLNTARSEHTATLQSNGMVLVAGGDQDGCDGLASAELYDPASGTWAATGNLNAARTLHTATLLADGNVLVAAGFNAPGCNPAGSLSSAELYEVATPTPTPTPTPGPITLSAAKRKVGGINTVRLTWSGATSANIDIYRDGPPPIVTVPNTGTYIDSTGDTGRARYTYKVCEAGTATCSNDARVTFRQ